MLNAAISTSQMRDDKERQRRLARLAHLGVPQAFHAQITARSPPRGHTLIHAAIILASIGLALCALTAWSRFVDTIAERTAQTAGAQLYYSDLGLESLGGLFSVLFTAGWLCASLTRHRGSEAARNATAHDLLHEPAKHKAITDRLWLWMVARQFWTARDADDFLDQLASNVVRYLRRAALGGLAVTVLLSWVLPAHYSQVTDSAIEDHQLRFWPRTSARPLTNALTLITGCPVLPHDGSTLIYSIHFSDGSDVDLGSWQPVRGDRLEALENISSHLLNVAHLRFSNAIGSAPLDPNCLMELGGPPGSERATRLSRLLRANQVASASSSSTQ